MYTYISTRERGKRGYVLRWETRILDNETIYRRERFEINFCSVDDLLVNESKMPMNESALL